MDLIHWNAEMIAGVSYAVNQSTSVLAIGFTELLHSKYARKSRSSFASHSSLLKGRLAVSADRSAHGC